MPHATPAPRGRQAHRLADDLAQAPGLPFADLLPTESVAQALAQESVTFYDPRLPVALSPPRSRPPHAPPPPPLPASRPGRPPRGLPPCPADPSAYCKARGRLPEGLLARLTRDTGRQTQDEAPPAWRWEG